MGLRAKAVPNAVLPVTALTAASAAVEVRPIRDRRESRSAAAEANCISVSCRRLEMDCRDSERRCSSSVAVMSSCTNDNRAAGTREAMRYPSPHKPYIVLRDSLCSCEAHGMRTTSRTHIDCVSYPPPNLLFRKSVSFAWIWIS